MLVTHYFHHMKLLLLMGWEMGGCSSPNQPSIDKLLYKTSSRLMAVFKNSGIEIWFPYVEGGISNLHDDILYLYLMMLEDVLNRQSRVHLCLLLPDVPSFHKWGEGGGGAAWTCYEEHPANQRIIPAEREGDVSFIGCSFSHVCWKYSVPRGLDAACVRRGSSRKAVEMDI
ncbi:uncharacterized protein LOC117282158 [Cryptotermes secundus]|uniref:uncharacterized protein LOC117282158 n=1 Tax=Cryptotermes secundus TaxID=105785 RepID=UPI001454D06A|nr:uncharacterized protein LOC117282158 [Cryptotermes secundus]